MSSTISVVLQFGEFVPPLNWQREESRQRDITNRRDQTSCRLTRVRRDRPAGPGGSGALLWVGAYSDRTNSTANGVANISHSLSVMSGTFTDAGTTQSWVPSGIVTQQSGRESCSSPCEQQARPDSATQDAISPAEHGSSAAAQRTTGEVPLSANPR